MKISKILLGALVVLSASLGQAVQAQTYHINEIANNMRDVTDAATVVAGDDNYTQVALPFNFNLYGSDYSSAFISTNGFMSFTFGSHGCCQGQNFPGAYIGAGAAPAWTDWISEVRAETLGTAGSREFVVSWSGHEYFNGAAGNFQAILHEGSNNVEFQYGDTTVNWHTVTAGIQNGDGNEGVSVETSNLSNRGFMISAVPEPESYALMLAGLGLLGVVARRKKQA